MFICTVGHGMHGRYFYSKVLLLSWWVGMVRWWGGKAM